MNFTKSAINADITRVVEAQSTNSTRQLTDSDAEQDILEELIENSKPPIASKLHYLLKTPFRYPPLKYGSRFGNKNEKGIFYASMDIDTALCEYAYLTFKFLLDSEAKLRPGFIQRTSFQVNISLKERLDLTKDKWKQKKNKISNPTTHVYAQEIGKKARNAGIKAISYYSARKKDGINVAVLTPEVFKGKKVKNFKHWTAYVDYNTIEFTYDGKEEQKQVFFLKDFLVKDRFPGN